MRIDPGAAGAAYHLFVVNLITGIAMCRCHFPLPPETRIDRRLEGCVWDRQTDEGLDVLVYPVLCTAGCFAQVGLWERFGGRSVPGLGLAECNGPFWPWDLGTSPQLAVPSSVFPLALKGGSCWAATAWEKPHPCSSVLPAAPGVPGPPRPWRALWSGAGTRGRRSRAGVSPHPWEL